MIFNAFILWFVTLCTQQTPSASSAAPTSLPPGALYYTGFEQGTFPEDLEWSTAGDGLWGLTTERANSGIYSIKSPDLSNDDLTQLVSNATFTTDPTWEGGTLVLSILAGVSMPFDNFRYLVDGQMRGALTDKSTFENLQIPLGPGAHEITFLYTFNPAGLTNFPPEPPSRIGAVYIDDVYFLPAGVTIAPTGPLMTVPTASPAASVDVSTSSPTFESGQSTIAPASVSSSDAPTPILSSDAFFDGFETSDFSGLEWSITGVQAWAVDNSNPYQVGTALFDSFFLYQVVIV